MAGAVAKTLEHGGALVVEAGTGIGKTFAYLVPALLSGSSIMICTATKTLQDQLYKRDIPQLLKLLGLPRRTAALKGRSSYLCIERLAQSFNTMPAPDPRTHAQLTRVVAWSGRTLTGDLAELSEMDERSPLIPRITSTRESCTGSACPSFRQCHVNVARREALAADVLVVNHHLFFSDLLVRETGMAELLPTVQGVIFDEAHQLNDIGVQFLGRHLSTGQLVGLSRDCRLTGRDHARGFQDWDGLSANIEQAVQKLLESTGHFSPGERLPWWGRHPEGTSASQWQTGIADLYGAVGALMSALAVVRETGPELSRLHSRVVDLFGLLTAFLAPRDDETVRWLEAGVSLRLVECPMDIAGSLRKGLLPLGQQVGQPRSLVFTSASLGIDPTLSAFTQSCGLTGAEVLKIPSPFDYQAQAALYVPRHLPDPTHPAHSVAVARLAASLARSVRGATLILTTSLRALSVIAETLQQTGGLASEMEVLVQGQLAKRSLIERFRQGSGGDNAACVMVASASFWEGLDLPGEMLKVVVIDKLPFPSLSEPVVQARAHRMEALGKNVFREYYLPQAAIALRQGAGRLIRTETDRGLLVICDGRLHSKSYGRRLLAALPPMRRLDHEEDLQATLAALTRPSTTDLSET
jgi:ATP-dependent DNA helicase DinG